MTKLDLKDVTIIIPYYKDSMEREENLNCVYKFIASNFHTNILIVKYAGSNSPVPYDAKTLILTGWDGMFHRTKVINEGIKEAKTPYVAIWDADCIFLRSSILDAVEMLRNGATLTYPFGGDFVDINRSYIKDNYIVESESFAKESVGGCCFLNRDNYWMCGLENEYYKKHCPDDVDRYHRVKTLGYRVERVDGKCFHISHPPSSNSGVNNYTVQNNAEWLKVKEMGKEELIEYIRTWEWIR